jgi:hypothetical protein
VQALAVFAEKKDRAQHTIDVRLDQAAYARQDLVQGASDKNHFERIENLFSRQMETRCSLLQRVFKIGCVV